MNEELNLENPQQPARKSPFFYCPTTPPQTQEHLSFYIFSPHFSPEDAKGFEV